MSTELDTCNLDNDCGNQDDDEQWVVEEVSENIDFSWLEFSGVYLVEYLHKHESVEENAVVFTRLNSPLFHSDWGLDSEQLRT